MGINEKLAKEIEALTVEDRFGHSVRCFFYILLSFDVRDYFVDQKFFFLIMYLLQAVVWTEFSFDDTTNTRNAKFYGEYFFMEY